MLVKHDSVPGRSKFGREQIEAYFDRLSLPHDARVYNVSNSSPEEQLGYLALLHRCHLRKIPFENLSLHYSMHRAVHATLPQVFDKIIHQPGRGGYCVENNLIFHTLLWSLGFNAYLVPSRIYVSETRYLALSHCLNIVNIGNDQYAVDVGFGGNVATLPLKLVDGLAQAEEGNPAQVRVRWDTIAEGLTSHTKYWIYEHRVDDEAEWMTQYCLADFEILPSDLPVMNLSPSTSPRLFFTYKVICLKFTTEGDDYPIDGIRAALSGKQVLADSPDDGVIDGVLILDGPTFKWRKKGIKQWEVTLKSESERLQVLEKVIGISLSEDEKSAIVGTVAAIHPSTSN